MLDTHISVTAPVGYGLHALAPSASLIGYSIIWYNSKFACKILKDGTDIDENGRCRCWDTPDFS